MQGAVGAEIQRKQALLLKTSSSKFKLVILHTAETKCSRADGVEDRGFSSTKTSAVARSAGVVARLRSRGDESILISAERILISAVYMWISAVYMTSFTNKTH
jgi:hypothetical protein